MKNLITLIKREWWEWKTSVYGLFVVIAILGFLFLIPIMKFSSGDFDHLNLNMNFSDGNFEVNIEDASIEFSNPNDSLLIKTKNGINIKTHQHELSSTIITGSGISLIWAFSSFQILLTFLALFYFSDSLYKERANNSTYYFRSLPINEHYILLSKYISGFIGIILATFVFMVFFSGYIRLVLFTLNNHLYNLISPIIARIEFLDYLFDISIFQFISLIWLSPIIFFLVLVSSFVKRRPLIIGVVGPILTMLAIFIIFGNNDIYSVTYDLTWKQVFSMFGDIINMQIDQLNLIVDRINENGSYSDSVEIYKSFNGYLFTARTAGSIIVSFILYICTWFAYRKNLPTG